MQSVRNDKLWSGSLAYSEKFDDWFRKLQELERVVLCIILMHLFCFHELVVKVLLALTQSSCVCSRYDARGQSRDAEETWHANSEEANGSSINSWRSNFQVAEWNGDGLMGYKSAGLRIMKAFLSATPEQKLYFQCLPPLAPRVLHTSTC